MGCVANSGRAELVSGVGDGRNRQGTAVSHQKDARQLASKVGDGGLLAMWVMGACEGLMMSTILDPCSPLTVGCRLSRHSDAHSWLLHQVCVRTVPLSLNCIKCRVVVPCSHTCCRATLKQWTCFRVKPPVCRVDASFQVNCRTSDVRA